MAFFILLLFAILKNSLAPFRNWPVTSLPSVSTTLALPSRTSSPSPPIISDGCLGVVRPPICSGQSGTCSSSIESLNTFSSSLCPPSYRHSAPVRQALTMIPGLLLAEACIEALYHFFRIKKSPYQGLLEQGTQGQLFKPTLRPYASSISHQPAGQGPQYLHPLDAP